MGRQKKLKKKLSATIKNMAKDVAAKHGIKAARSEIRFRLSK